MIKVDNLNYYIKNKQGYSRKESYNPTGSYNSLKKIDRDVFVKPSQNISFTSLLKSSNILKTNKSLTSHEKIINRAYKKFIEESFFSDLGRIYMFLDTKIPSHLKDNTCLGLCEKLKKNYKTLGYDKNYFLKVDDATHYVLISEVDGKIFMSDPQALLTKPINLTKIKNSKSRQQHLNFYPYFTNKNGGKSLGEYRIKFIDKDKFEINANKPGEDEKTIFINLSKKTIEKPNPFTQELAFDKRQAYFQLRVFDKKNKKTIKLIALIKEGFDKKIIDESKLLIKDSEDPEKLYKYGTKEFDKYMKLISKKLKLSINEIKSYMLKGVELYYENAPKAFHFDN